MAKYKLVMLAAMGLASLYMMHLLAMDYMKIQRVVAAAQRLSPVIANAARVILRGKRDLSSQKLTTYSSSSNKLNSMQKLMKTTTTKNIPNLMKLTAEEEVALDHFKDNLKFNWDAILRMDLLKCSQSLICQITAGAGKNETIAENIEMVIQFSYHMAPDKVKNAYIKGLEFLNKPDMCYSEYPFCVYSANTMIKILKWFIRFIGDSEG